MSDPETADTSATSARERLRRTLPALATLPAIGGWCHIPGGFAAEIMGTAGFDWCCVDRQHGLCDEQDLFDMIRGLDAAGTPTFVRVSHVSQPEIGRALDAGARGVIVPMVDSAQDAELIARACRFPPDGARSWGPTREKLYRTPDAAAQNDRVACIAMVETEAGLAALPEIADVPGIDGIFLGPADLGLALGGDQEAVTAVARRIVETCAARGMLAGVMSAEVESVGSWAELGFTFIAVTPDSGLLFAAAKAAATSALLAARR